MQTDTKKEYVQRSKNLKKILFPNGEGDIFFIDAENRKDNLRTIQKKEIDISISSLVYSWSDLKKDYYNGSMHEENLILKFQLQVRRLYELSVVFSCDVIHDFMVSLKTYAKDADIRKSHQREVIQTHIDLIFLAYKRDVKIEDNATVKALWDTLRQVY